MSIHSLIAVLMGSSSLSQYNPLLISQALRNYVLGVPIGSMALTYTSHSTIIGLPTDNVGLVETVNSVVIGVRDVAVVDMTSNILLALKGVGVFEAIIHAFGKPLTEGYGFNYGENYGSNIV